MNSVAPGGLEDETEESLSGNVSRSLTEDRQEKFNPEAAHQIMLGLFFGTIFGFLLQKGGVAKYEVLMGALFLTDFTVMKIMLTAIATGMIGIFSLHALELVELHVKPTRYAANIIGGLIFGVGFGLLGYCPGTGAAALGQGNFDAIAGVFGLLAGSYLYAEMSGFLDSTILKWGNRGKIMLPELVGARRIIFILWFVPLLAAILYLLETFFPTAR
ncbi:YeeE/YedE thiosulfate transporter family protein [Nitrosospira sp. Is2]|uniref:YeeE/YedE thiosulfate transporter family protein n=1 Tax=Nitrosospira sp. Is2 TaxID=3080532 RepID=UPI002952F98A|nr:YeeE/YedE thiosulfate transporter family protein [Nitrosospira sp. Is2]WON73695.1 YeeE/YedE thiosulfate transporter family protein [Nitrosospira sp. Is2]